nr:hypothetical protein [uncultured Carboxylicivirga sp.]
MKRYFLVTVCMVIGALAYSQESGSYFNFRIENNRVLWQKVFETADNYTQLVSKIKDSGLLANIEEDNYKLRGELKCVDIQPLQYGLMDLSTPEYLDKNFVRGFVIIEFKPGKYRITIKNLMLVEKRVDSLSHVGATKLIEREVYKSGKIELNNQFKKHTSKQVSDTFLRYFDISLIKEDDNW